jgi:hypothetical protein
MTKMIIPTIVLSWALAASAHADGFYSANVGGCTVDPKSAPHVYSNGTVSFKDNYIGLIILYCPITFTLTPPSVLEIQAVDTGPGNNTSVQALYRKIDANTGYDSMIAFAISGDDTVGRPHYYTTGFTDSYDPHNYRYYVMIQMLRDNPQQRVRILGVAVY